MKQSMAGVLYERKLIIRLQQNKRIYISPEGKARYVNYPFLEEMIKKEGYGDENSDNNRVAQMET